MNGTMRQFTRWISAGLLIPAIVMVITTGAGIGAEAGRVKLDGREIILHDDNTWEYAGNTGETQVNNDEDCVRIKSKTLPASICLDESYWHLGAEGTAAEFNFASNDDKLFLLMITEKDEIALDQFEKAVLANAQSAAGLKPVEVHVKERIDALDLEWGRMVYTANIDGLLIKYENYFTTMKNKGSVQFVFYATPDDYENLDTQIEKAIKQIAVE